MVETIAFGRFRLLRRIGTGGMGAVYQALDTRDEAIVAIKMLLPHAADESAGVERFKTEYRALARLRHPNIVQVFDAGVENDTRYIVMEYLEAKDIRSYMRGLDADRNRDLELRACLRQIFLALGHMHARQVIHRDLKPENILVDATGHLKLTDFGVVRELQRGSLPNTGLTGTFAYMAPEQITESGMDGRADLYSVGVLAYELLVGEFPFPVEPPAAALHHHVRTQAKNVLTLKPSADPVLAKLVDRLLQKSPEQRFQSAEDAALFISDGVVPEIDAAPPISRHTGKIPAPYRLDEVLRGLSQKSKTLLEILSLLPQRIPHSWFITLCESVGGQCEDDLFARDLIEHEKFSAPVRFANNWLRQGVNQAIPTGRRRQLHLMIAACLRHPALGLFHAAPMSLAHHYAASRQLQAAIRCLCHDVLLRVRAADRVGAQTRLHQAFALSRQLKEQKGVGRRLKRYQRRLGL